MKHTVEEIKAWRAKMSDIARKVKLMGKEAREALAERCGFLTCEGHRLSTYNTCFLVYQGVSASEGLMVGGFNQWGKVGRRVQAGEHAAGYIYVPMGASKASDEAEDGDSENGGSVWFRLVPVFVLDQTEVVNEGVGALVGASA